MKTNQKGFTLVEIAIVLVIIGLLLGGVLKGQELIQSAKVKSLKTSIDGIQAAYYGYQDRLQSLPGDDNGNGAIEGDYDEASDNTKESRKIWADLRSEKFISGAGYPQPKSPFGTIIGVSSTAPSGITLTGNLICVKGVPTKLAKQYDKKYDDGVAASGSVRGDEAYSTTNPSVVICQEL